MLLHSFGQQDAAVPAKPEPGAAQPAAAAPALLEYQVLTARNPSNLDHLCKMMIAKGWEPQGGVGVGGLAVDPGSGRSYQKELHYAQAMVRRLPKGGD